MNYAELTIDIQNYLQNTETSFVATIPTIVQQTEQRIMMLIDLPIYSKTSTSTLNSGNQYLETPSDFLAPFYVAVIVDGEYSFLLNKDASFMRECYPSPTTTGIPRFYSLFNEDVFILGPTPDDSYAVELQYKCLPQSIVTAGTSWLGANAPDALLYGCLVEGYIYMKGDADLLGVYTARFQEAISRLKILGEGKDQTDMYRSHLPTVPLS